MKKILSVALSTAMAFSMFASVAFGAEANLTPQQKFDVLKEASILTGMPDGSSALDKTLTRAELAKIIVKSIGLEEVNATSYNDKNYSIHWARTFIEAATQAGILEGTDATKKLFNPSGNVTVQELAAVLVRALKLEVPADANNSASAWAKGYVQAAVDAGFIDASATFTANATRSQAVVAAYAIYDAANFKVTNAEAVDATHVKLTLSTGEVVDVTLTTPLVANTATDLEYTTADGKVLKYTVTYVVTTATKVESAAATNLKEVVVTFDGKVDKETAEEVANYSLKSGKALASASLAADEKTVTLTLETAYTLNNNRVDYVSVSNVKAGTSTISAKDVSFTTSDNVLPEVSSVKSLGTKSIKVVFSEPVKLPLQSNFELDGKTYYGKIDQPTSRTVILTPYSGVALSVGEHKLVVKGINDFANFVSLTSTHDITVVEDKDAPTITEATATLETVTLTFSEEVDVSTVDPANVYWKSGDTKKKSYKKTVVEDNKIKFTFDKGVSLPTGAVTIFVEGVKDYSGNKIADNTSVVVTPEVDQTRPEVKKVEAINSKKIRVTFSKDLETDSAQAKGNYSVLNKDAKVVVVKGATFVGTSRNVVDVELYGDLSAGENTLTIKNVKDNTRLENTMLDYTGKVNLADTAKPKLDSKLVNRADNSVILSFNKNMDIATLTDYTNYNVIVDGVRVQLSENLATITVLNDKTVAIKFAENVKLTASNDATTSLKKASRLYVLSVKDVAGNLLDEFASEGTNFVDLTNDTLALGLGTYDGDYPSYNAALIDNKTVAVKLSSAVQYAQSDAIVIRNAAGTVLPSSTQADGTSVIKATLSSELTDTDASNLQVTVNYGKLTTYAGVAGTNADVTVNSLLDKVAPVVVENGVTVAGNVISIKFSEAISLEAAYADLLEKDFAIYRYHDTKKLDSTKYDVAVSDTHDDVLEITLLDVADRLDNTTYDIKFNGTQFLTDRSVVKNQIASFDVTSPAVGYVSTATTVTVAGANTIAAPASGEVSTTTYTATVKNQNGETLPTAPVVYTVTDAEGDTVAGATITAAGVLTITDVVPADTELTVKAVSGSASVTKVVTVVAE